MPFYLTTQVFKGGVFALGALNIEMVSFEETTFNYFLLSLPRLMTRVEGNAFL